MRASVVGVGAGVNSQVDPVATAIRGTPTKELARANLYSRVMESG